MNAQADSAYARLRDRFTRIATLNEAQSMLGWDAAAMMPEGGARRARGPIGGAGGASPQPIGSRSGGR